jgi:hypothetical protein
MSEQIRALETATRDRFNSFVAINTARSVWWETVDRTVDDPIITVEFIDNRQLPRSEKSMIVASRYALRLGVKLMPDNDKGTGWLTAPIVIFENGNSVGVHDEYNKLTEILCSYEPTPYHVPRGVNELMDHLETLKTKNLLIPARDREFPL